MKSTGYCELSFGTECALEYGMKTLLLGLVIGLVLLCAIAQQLAPVIVRLVVLR